METTEPQKPLPLQFQLLYNYEVESQESLKKARVYSCFKVELNATPIYRLIHYEFERHFVSAGQLFKATGLTLTEGFFLFGLKPVDFEVDFLITQFPYCDIWVNLEQARSMAMALDVEYELGLLLGEELDDCFSSDNIHRNEIMHNWIVPSIPTVQYSTRALLEATFDEIQLLDPLNRKIRTQISRSKQAGMIMKDRTETGLVRWQVWAYDQFLQSSNKEEEDKKMSLDRTGAVWDTLQGILTDLQNMSRGGDAKTRVLSDNMMLGNMPLKKEYLGHSLPLQQLYIAVMAEKVVNELTLIHAKSHLTDQQPRPPSSLSDAEKVTRLSTETSTTTSHQDNMLFHDRMDLLEQELYRVKKRSKKKLEDIQSYQDELAQQLNEIIRWKLQSDRTRKSERVWMLMLMFSVIFAVVSLRTFFL